jgi:hypothetical protein
MSDPKTFREVNFVLDGLEKRVGLLTKIGGGIAALLVAILGVLGTLYSEIGKVQTDVAATRATVDGLNTRLTSMDTDVKAIRADQGQIRAAVLVIAAVIEWRSKKSRNAVCASVKCC